MKNLTCGARQIPCQAAECMVGLADRFQRAGNVRRDLCGSRYFPAETSTCQFVSSRYISMPFWRSEMSRYALSPHGSSGSSSPAARAKNKALLQSQL